MKLLQRKIIVGAIVVSVAASMYARIVEKIVVKVNDEIITMYDIAKKRKSVIREHRMLRKAIPRNINKVAQDQLINEKLVFQLAKKKGIVVNRLEVEDRINKVMKRSGRDGKPLSLADFKKRLKKEGLTYADFFEMQKRRMTMQKLFRKEQKGLKPTDDEIKAIYKKVKPKKYRIMHMYVPLSPYAGFTVRGRVEKRIAKISKQLKANRWNFANIARYNGARFKDFGYMVPSSKMPKYLYPIFSTRTGRVYKGKYKDFRVVNEIPGYAGFHAVIVYDVKVMPFDEARSQLQGVAMQKKMEKALKTWVENLRKKAVIVIKK